MRLSSAFIFIAFALLASASPIDEYSQKTNSLWRRKAAKIDRYDHPPFNPGPPPRVHSIVYQDNRMIIEDQFRDNVLVQSIVTLDDRQPVTFIRPSRVLLPRHFVVSFDIHGARPLKARSWYFWTGRRRELWLTLLMCPNTLEWRIFLRSTVHNSGYTLEETHLDNGGIATNFYGNGNLVLLYVRAPHPHGHWEQEAMVHNFEAVHWLPFPTQG